MKLQQRFMVICALAWIICFCSALHAMDEHKQPAVLATTSLIETMATAVGGDKIQVVALIPAGICPGHFDMAPQQIQLIHNSSLVLYHGWESWIDEIQKLAPSSNTHFISLEKEGNLMIPDHYLNALKVVTEQISCLDPVNAKFYQEKGRAYSQTIANVAILLKQKAKKIQGMPVICSRLQEHFLRWLGLNIIATYGRPDELTPRTIIELIKSGRQHHIKAVIDNIQSGENAGLMIAKDIPAIHIALTNFPINESYLEALKNNINKLLACAP